MKKKNVIGSVHFYSATKEARRRAKAQNCPEKKKNKSPQAQTN
jgi:hypothetical protein